MASLFDNFKRGWNRSFDRPNQQNQPHPVMLENVRRHLRNSGLTPAQQSHGLLMFMQGNQEGYNKFMSDSLATPDVPAKIQQEQYLNQLYQGTGGKTDVEQLRQQAADSHATSRLNNPSGDLSGIPQGAMSPGIKGQMLDKQIEAINRYNMARQLFQPAGGVTVNTGNTGQGRMATPDEVQLYGGNWAAGNRAWIPADGSKPEFFKMATPTSGESYNQAVFDDAVAGGGIDRAFNMLRNQDGSYDQSALQHQGLVRDAQGLGFLENASRVAINKLFDDKDLTRSQKSFSYIDRVLRSLGYTVSGAVIGADEVSDLYSIYAPVVGDTPDTIEYKRELLKRFVNEMNTRLSGGERLSKEDYINQAKAFGEQYMAPDASNSPVMEQNTINPIPTPEALQPAPQVPGRHPSEFLDPDVWK